MTDKILILDFGSQYTQLITRRTRELEIFSEVQPCFIKKSEVDIKDIKGIILSGGPASVTAEDAPEFDQSWLDLDVPILGICYGMQLISSLLGGSIESSNTREYGHADLKISDNLLFKDISIDTFSVWMSHGDHVAKLPDNFKKIASSETLENAAIYNAEKSIYGLQFHPEVVHSQNGDKIISNFLFEVCKVTDKWKSEDFIQSQIDEINNKVGESQTVICGLSGGVDSTVAAVLVNKAVGDRLTCIFVDNGLLRKDEALEVVNSLGEKGIGLNLIKIDAADRFISALKGVTDPEKKRKIIGKVFIDVFEEEAKKIDNAKLYRNFVSRCLMKVLL
ncbi:UNVERIFIED_CONTAM: hypothetical protein GTU68_026570 [Idotea baltica]|nr:hypothetical protein [Idotea baltica]